MGAFHSRQDRRNIRYDLLPPEPKADRRGARRAVTPRDIVDADFVVIREPSPRPRGTGMPHNDNKRASSRERPAVGLKVLRDVVIALTMAGEKLLRQVPAGRFPFFIAAVFITVFGLAGGFSAFARGSAPVTPSPTLDITHVNLTPQDANGMRVLLLNAIIENNTGATRALSPIRADLVAGGRLMTRTMIAPPAGELGPGQSRGIAMRLPHPGGKMPEVRLSFAETGVSIR